MDIIVSLQNLLAQWWFWLVIGASVMFAAGNYIDELLLDKFEQPVGVLVIISGLFGRVLMLVFAALAFYVDGATLALSNKELLQAVLIGVLELLWVIPYLYATNRRGAMIAGPLFQGVPVIAFALEAWLGSIPLPVQIVGALLIVSGGILLSIEEGEDENGKSTRKVDWITLGLMTLAVFMVAVIYVLFRDMAESNNYVGVGFWSGLGMSLTAGAIWRVYRPYRHDFDAFCRNVDAKAVSTQLLNEVMDTGGAYLNHLANLLGPSVMVVSAFNAAQPIFIGLIGLGLGALGVGGLSVGKTNWKTVAVIVLSIFLIATGTVLVAFGET